jgi:MinD-like ATPase involved in chromosome partitioning or flagellar assembly
VIQRAADAYPVSVAFRPLESLHFLDGKTSRVAAEIVAFHQPDHPVSKEYETLAEAIEAQFPMGGSHVLMFMGAGSGVGTTTVVLNLAFSWARPRNKRIVVVDAGDVATGTTHGSLVKKLGLSASSLAPPTDAPWREAPEVRGLQEIKQSNLFVLCSPIHSSESGPKLSAQGMRDILRQLRKQFDLILIDAPPPLCISPQGRGEIQGELAALASGCDGVYLVVPQSAVETPGTDELLEAIQGQGIRLGGCVLTDKRQG